MKISKIEMFEPTHISDRVVRQSSMFTIEPVLNITIEDLQKTISSRLGTNWQKNAKIEMLWVSAKHVHKIQKELKKLGVMRSTLFPGLDSLCWDLKNDLFE